MATELGVDDSSGSTSLTKQPESAARGTVVLSIGQGISFASNAFILIFAARALVTEAYGRFVIVFFFLSWINIISAAIILPGLKKIVSENARRFHAALLFAAKWYSLAMLALTVLCCCAAPMLSGTLGDGHLKPLLFLAGLQIPFLGMANLGGSLLSGLRRFVGASLVKVSYALIAAPATCVFLLLGFGVTGAIAGLLAGAAAAGTVSAVLLMKELRRIPSVSYRQMSPRVVYWTAVALPASVGLRTLMLLDIWFIKIMMQDPRAAGIYAVAYSLSRFPMFMVHGLGGAVFPTVSRALEKRQRKRARAVSGQAMRFIIILFIPICFITAAASSEIIAFLFSSRYVEAAQSLTVLVLAIFFAGQMHLASRLLAAANRPGLRLVVICGLLLCGVASNVLLIPRFGILGAAFASLIVFGIGAIATTALVFRFIGVAPPVSTALRCGVAGCVVYIAGCAWPASGLAVAAKLAILSLLYAVMLFLLRELRKGDLLRIWRSIRE